MATPETTARSELRSVRFGDAPMSQKRALLLSPAFASGTSRSLKSSRWPSSLGTIFSKWPASTP